MNIDGPFLLTTPSPHDSSIYFLDRPTLSAVVFRDSTFHTSRTQLCEVTTPRYQHGPILTLLTVPQCYIEIKLSTIHRRLL